MRINYLYACVYANQQEEKESVDHKNKIMHNN